MARVKEQEGVGEEFANLSERFLFECRTGKLDQIFE